MTEIEMLDVIENITGEHDKSTVSTYLYLAKQKVLSQAFPFGDAGDLPVKYEGVTIEIAVFLLNKRGAEGETRHNENGIDRSYDTSDVPLDLLRKITPLAGVIR